jgi:hypothetical protein
MKSAWVCPAAILQDVSKLKPEMALQLFKLAHDLGSSSPWWGNPGYIGFKELCPSVLQNLIKDSKCP